MLRNLVFGALFLLAGNGKVFAYGMAGCGLGSLAVPDDAKPVELMQIIASVGNNIFSNQTFAISSGTSGCDDASVKTAQSLQYIEGNKFALQTEASRGQGESIKELSLILGCPSNDFQKTLQKNYGKVFQSSQQSAELILNRISNVIKNDEKLNSICSLNQIG